MNIEHLLESCRVHDLEALTRSLRTDSSIIIASNYDGVTPLHIASLYGFEDGVDFLLERGANVHARTVDGSTPLCHACSGGYTRIAAKLLQYGSQVNPPCLLMTPLHEAAMNGSVDCCKLLISSGAKIEVSDCWYGTPLHCASFRSHLATANALLEAGANVNARKIHSTPLHYSAENGDVPMIALLLLYGADVLAKDNNERRPSDFFHPSEGYHPGRQLLAYFENNPRTLRQLCRLRVQSSQSRSIIANLTEYPECLKKFLMYDNLLSFLQNVVT